MKPKPPDPMAADAVTRAAREIVAASTAVSDAQRSARSALEALRGAPYSDAEWEEAAENLRRFYAIAAKWSADAKR